ncbi:MAG: hypothetical protein ACJAVI_006005, partial [Candidatus Azotimanducaceae bacterium]
MIQRSRFSTLFALSLLLGLTHNANATVMEMDDLNIISQFGNASDGLRYLDMSYSDGLTKTAALANAQGTYANARLAIATEFDDLFAAAGIGYDQSGETASDSFLPGFGHFLSSGSNYDGGLLSLALGHTSPGQTYIWTVPDGNNSSTTSFDYIHFTSSYVSMDQSSATPANSVLGWLIVSEAPVPTVPAPPALILFAFGLAG